MPASTARSTRKRLTSEQVFDESMCREAAEELLDIPDRVEDRRAEAREYRVTMVALAHAIYHATQFKPDVWCEDE